MVRSARRSSSAFCLLTANFTVGMAAPASTSITVIATRSSIIVKPRGAGARRVARRPILGASLLLHHDRHPHLLGWQRAGGRIEHRQIAERQRSRPGLLGTEGQVDERSLAAHAGPAPLARQPDDH